MQSNPTNLKEFSSYLRSSSLHLDILCLQEVSHFRSQSTLTESQVRSFSFAFPNCSLVVSKHCAIICLNSRYSLVDTEVLLDERCLVASVVDASSNVLCKVANVYGPAQSSDRPSFISDFLSLSVWSDVFNTPWMVMGDFNIHLHSLSTSRQADVAPFVHWLRTHFVNCHPDGLATFPKSNTCIDYIFGHSSLAPRLTNSQLLYMPSRWTDHSLLTVEMLPATASIGPGSWRFNPTLLDDKEFVALLNATVSLFFSGAVGGGSKGVNTSQGSSGDSESTVARWESFKLLLKCCAQKYTRSMKARFKNKVFTLQLERIRALSTSVSGVETRNAIGQTDRVSTASGDAEQQVRQLEVLIEDQIQKETSQNMLRSATRWLEQGERSNKYFYRSIKVRESQQTIQSLKCSTTGDILVEAAAINREAQGFYQRLYTPDAVDAEAIDTLLGNVPTDVRLSSLDGDMLMELPTRDVLLSLLTHAPKSKSPGLDGLPFELYQYLAGVSTDFLDLLVDVLGAAFSGVFPPSWQQTRMVLLFKKGDPQLLVNWRPLSLINSDAKLFTKLIANRMNKVLPKLINPYQTGFLPHRLISDNGWLNQLLMSHLRVVAPDLPQVAVLLDQEKAYDRVHPEYLCRVLLRFGFPGELVSCLSSLFFGTKISVSINGWLGAPVPQLRGLRQGDPLSPLLFNLAFEPLLRSLLACPGLSGVTLSPVNIPRKWKPSPVEVRVDHGTGSRNWTLDFVSGSVAPPPVKILSYADDLEVFLSSPEEWSVLLSVLDLYGRASNAKVNISKTVLVSLSGVSHSAWVALADSTGLQWHDAHSRGAVRYLGYPLYHTESQLQDYLDGVLVKVQRHSNLLKQRNLSIRGAGLVANSLLLSKVYHLLRVVPGGATTASWLKSLTTVVREYLVSFRPGVAWSTLCLPRKFGGVGLVDIADQSLALHLVYLQRLLRPPSPSDFVSSWLVYAFQVYTGHKSILPWFCFPGLYQSRVSSVPALTHLGKLLLRLPKLVPSSGWSARWFLDLPLCSVLSTVPSVRPPRDPSSLDPRFLVSDVSFWQPDLGIVDGVTSHLAWSSRVLRPVFLALNRDRGPVSLVFPPVMDSKIVLSQADYFAMPRSDGATSWMPDCTHWTVSNSSRSAAPVARLSLGALRRYWHPAKGTITSRMGPPLKLPAHLLLSPALWRLFWSLEMPAKAFTPWWRLLHDRVPHRSWCHKIMPTKVLSPACALCGFATEDLYHFVVGCHVKSFFWQDVVSLLSLQELLPSASSIWLALTTFCSGSDLLVIDEDVLIALGAAYSTLWKYHWRCVIDEEPWIASAAINMVRQDHSTLFSSLSLASVQAGTLALPVITV
ncbi:uncharacterized protein ATC70_007325 [Mucor velutinosus]|uniref:Reverse transcriptase domain-containing protein n=1 Tax=Mucor velutinosus TaxID=708070 RepID=A0AAN7DRN5_9FUNG|nr:hypothetical protein ATC70_007325 [Mucor velutinosus]